MPWTIPSYNALLAGLLFILAVAPFSETCAQPQRHFTLPAGKTANDIVGDEVIIKLKNQAPSTGAKGAAPAAVIDIHTLPAMIGADKVIALDPGIAAPSGRIAPSKYLSGVYRLKLKQPNALQVINTLLRYENVVYAEPVFKESLFFVPNDPDAATNTSRQTYLSSIKAYDAWDVTRGDSTTIIAIVDTGVDYHHEDLSSNIYVNEGDPVDGADNDSNGYIDDYLGWDFANRDSDVMADFSPHGSHVSGLSSARTNNALGIAGTGFSAKFAPLKAFRTQDNTSNGTYEAIIYAANQGYDVLNLSWGSVNSYNAAAQDIINYAALEKNMVVIAAAGNTNAELTFYPASYENVLSVGASTTTGTKASFATYGYYIDLLAPGSAVYSTRNDDTYGTGDGSSFSAPMVAGAAALLKTYFPDYSAVQIMEQLRITGQSVDDLTGNFAYRGLLGRGMLDMYAALTDTLSPSVRLYGFTPASQAGTKVYYGDTVYFDLSAVNWLRPATGLEVAFEPLSPHGEIPGANWAVPLLATNDSSHHTMSVIINEAAPPSTRIVIKAKITAADYNDFQYFEVLTEPDSSQVMSANMVLSIGSAGELGFMRDSLAFGSGLRWKNEIVAKQAGFAIGNSVTSLADNVVNNLVYSTKTNDFESSKYLKSYSGTAADSYFESAFSAAINEQQTALIEQKTMGWVHPADSNYLITEYRITNTSADTLFNLYAGLFTNWELGSPHQNHTLWIDSINTGISFSENGKRWGGIALLTDHSPTFFAADISNNNGHTPDADTVLSDSTKFVWLSSNLIKTEAGSLAGGNNTAQMNGVKLGNLPGLESEKIAFAWVSASTKQGIVAAVKRAKTRYESALTQPRSIATVYACENEPARIRLASGEQFNFYLDPKGTDNLLFQGNGYLTDTITSAATFYVRNTDEGFLGEVYSVNVRMDPIEAKFDINMDTVLLEEGVTPTIQYTNESTNGQSWFWDFGNGFQSTLKSPQTKYNQAGTYQVTLKAVSEAGCTSSLTKKILVANSGPIPVVDTPQVCEGQTVSLSAQNANRIRVYADSLVQNLIFDGTTFTTAPILRDTVFYITNADSLFQSRPLKLTVDLNQPSVGFQYMPDTTTLLPSLLLLGQSSQEVAYNWLVDSEPVGVEKNTTVLLNGRTDLQVELQVTNEQGCRSSETKNLLFTKSATPTVGDVEVCPGASYTIAPGNGNSFLFYLEGSETPIHIGKNYPVGEITDTVTVVVTGIDDLLESDPVEMKIIPSDFAANFSIDPAVLILKKQKTAVFTDLSSGATSWIWSINGTIVDISQNLVLAFDSAAVYEVSLTIGSDLGCDNSVTMQYQVLEVTSIDEIRSLFDLYPNPTTGKVYLRKNLPINSPLSIRILNLAGQEVVANYFEQVRDMTELSLEHLPAGVYQVVFSSQGHTWQQRLILQ